MSDNHNKVYVTEAGLQVTIKKIPPLLMQKVMNSIPLPKRPTYETKTISGRVEIFPLDEVSAKQTEHGEAQWEYYQDELTRTEALRNERVTTTAFLIGTECEIPEDGWDKNQEYLGIEVPPKKDKDFRRAHYLSTELSAKDIRGLMDAIMETLQTSEENIESAEDSFPDKVQG